MKIRVGDQLVSNRGVRHRVVKSAMVRSWYYSATLSEQLTLQSHNSGRKQKVTQIDLQSWIDYGRWTHVRIPRKIRLPLGI